MIVHTISNLNLRFHEFTNPADETIPEESELVILCGGFSDRTKRSLLYCETLAKKYPDKTFILNFSPYDLTTEVPSIIYSGVKARYDNLAINNLHYSTRPSDILECDILTLYGWPRVEIVPKKLERIFGEPRPKYLKDGECVNKAFRYFITAEELNQFYSDEKMRLIDWLNNGSDKKKILITGTAPENDPYSTEYSLYDDLDLSGITWIHGGSEYYDKKQNGVRLICNPGSGSARQKTFVI